MRRFYRLVACVVVACHLLTGVSTAASGRLVSYSQPSPVDIYNKKLVETTNKIISELKASKYSGAVVNGKIDFTKLPKDVKDNIVSRLESQGVYERNKSINDKLNAKVRKIDSDYAAKSKPYRDYINSNTSNLSAMWTSVASKDGLNAIVSAATMPIFVYSDLFSGGASSVVKTGAKWAKIQSKTKDVIKVISKIEKAAKTGEKAKKAKKVLKAMEFLNSTAGVFATNAASFGWTVKDLFDSKDVKDDVKSTIKSSIELIYGPITEELKTLPLTKFAFKMAESAFVSALVDRELTSALFDVVNDLAECLPAIGPVVEWYNKAQKAKDNLSDKFYEALYTSQSLASEHASKIAIAINDHQNELLKYNFNKADNLRSQYTPSPSTGSNKVKSSLALPISVTDDQKISIVSGSTGSIPNTGTVTTPVVPGPSPVTPGPAGYLPMGSPLTALQVSAVNAALGGAVFGDILRVGTATYGVAAKNIQDTVFLTDPDGVKCKKADVVVFKIENGSVTTKNLGQYYLYNSYPYAGVNVSNSGDLVVFFNHKTTGGTYAMAGNYYKLNKDTLAQTYASQPFTFANWGWFPRVTTNGDVEHFSFAGYYRCLNGSCGAYVDPGTFDLETNVIKADHSSQILGAANAYSQLPSDVVLKRMTGETTVTSLGQYSHLSWGKWNDGSGVPNNIYTNSHWIAGSLTPAIAIPTVGTATYSGQVLGRLSESGMISDVSGTTSLTANFGSRTLTGSFNNMKRANNTNWTSATVNAGWGAGTNQIKGSLAATNGMTGSVSGAFFGPAAEQVGGSWALKNSADQASGIFVGNKQ